MLHNIPNKTLTGYRAHKVLKAKEMICKIFKTLKLWFLWSLWRRKPGAGGFCLDLDKLYARVSSVLG